MPGGPRYLYVRSGPFLDRSHATVTTELEATRWAVRQLDGGAQRIEMVQNPGSKAEILHTMDRQHRFWRKSKTS